MSRKKESENNVVVGVRIRPMNEKEKSSGMRTSFQAHDDGMTVQSLNEYGEVVENIPFNHAFGSKETNQTIFDKIRLKIHANQHISWFYMTKLHQELMIHVWCTITSHIKPLYQGTAL